MIGKISGIVDHRGPDHVLLDVRGVGYIVHVSERTLAALPPEGEATSLYTELVVREDLLQLFGFATLLEKEWHRLLTTVQGVGAKAALSILGTLGAEGISRALALGDQRAVQSAPGVGPKLAQRVILELKSKAPALMAQGVGLMRRAEGEGSLIEPAPPAPASRPKSPARVDEAALARAAARSDALSALLNLGYGQGDAAAAIAQAADETPQAETPDLIRAALKRLAPKG